MNNRISRAGKGISLIITAAMLLSGCQENNVVENNNLPAEIETVATTTSATTPETTTTTTNTTTTTTTTTATTTTAATTTTTATAAETSVTVEAATAAATAAPVAAVTTRNRRTTAAATKVTTAKTHVCGYRGGTDYPKIKHDLKYMRELNSDFIGWLKIKDTPIDLPVVQATDNKFYLTHDFYGRYDNSKVGVTFADYHVPVTKDDRPQNLVVYGHNIRTGVGLAKITNYYPARYGSLDFYLKHPTIKYESVYGGESTYVVFAGMFVNTETKHGTVFNYHKYRDFSSKNVFYQYFEAVMDRSVFYNPSVNISYDDEFITLSTCYFPLGMDLETRFALFARKLRDGESADIDVSKAYINKSPLYFDYYYKVNGGEWAGRKWPTSLIKGYKKWSEKQQ